jgi:hypothetical protein
MQSLHAAALQQVYEIAQKKGATWRPLLNNL